MDSFTTTHQPGTEARICDVIGQDQTASCGRHAATHDMDDWEGWPTQRFRAALAGRSRQGGGD